MPGRQPGCQNGSVVGDSHSSCCTFPKFEAGQVEKNAVRLYDLAMNNRREGRMN